MSNKYGNAFANARQEQDDADIEAYEKSLVQQEEEKKIEETPAEGVEAEAWKKRHADTRRAWQKEKDAWSQREKELLAQVEQVRNSQAGAVPVTEEEMDAYIQKYPKVGAVISRLVNRGVQEALSGQQDRLSKIDEIEGDLRRERASKKLHELQPEFFGAGGKLPNGEPSISERKEFWDWLSDQPQEDQNVMNDGVDAYKASRLINDWKVTSGYLSQKPKSKNRNPVDAAAAVSTTRKPTVAEGPKGDYDFTESQIDKMSAREFEKYEEAIDEARAAGRIHYDISG
jgi:hypothetical protein